MIILSAENDEKKRSEAEDFLNQLYRLNNFIISNQEELEQLRSLSTSISGSTTEERTQTSPNPDKIPNIIAKIVDLEREIEEQTEQLLKLQKDVRDVINQVKDNDERLFLRYRYINFYQWKQIRYKMKCSDTQLQRIKNRAIESVEKILGSKC